MATDYNMILKIPEGRPLGKTYPMMSHATLPKTRPAFSLRVKP
jgi:hypothetical protein